MSLNWKEIDLILEELQLEGCFLQQIYQPVHQVIIFDLHKPGRSFALLICLAPGECRLHEFSGKMRNPKRPQRFASFLRARVRGGRIRAAAQLAGERIIKLQISKGAEETLIWIRLWSGAANMIVTDTAGQVLDACYRRKKRDEISGGQFHPETELATMQKSKGNGKKYQLRQLPGTGSFNSRIARYYQQQARDRDTEQQLQKALKHCTSQIDHHQAKLDALLGQQQELANHNRYKEIGDIIMACLGTIIPGRQWLQTVDFFHENQPVEIELQTDLSPQANAGLYYQRYKAARKQSERISEQIERCQALLAGLEQKQYRILEENDVDLIQELAVEKTVVRQQQSQSNIPGLQFKSGEFRLYVGRSAAENDVLLRKYVRGNDYWLHTRDYAGSYVFIKSLSGKTVPLDVLLDAGNLAVFYSKGKKSGKGDVYYTQVKYLRRAKHGKPGLVIPTREKNLYIVLDEARMEKLKKN